MSPAGEEGIGNQLERDHTGNGLLYRNHVIRVSAAVSCRLNKSVVRRNEIMFIV